MTPKLRRLLFLLGVVGAGFAVYLPLASTTKADVVDAGLLADCVPRLATCPLRLGAAYGTRSFRVERCPNPDGGRVEFILRQVPPGVQLLDINACVLSTTCTDPTLCPANAGEETDGGTLMLVAPDVCACLSRTATAGQCTNPLDGGDWKARAPGGWNNEMAPGTWTGVGCIAKPCGQLAGFPNWPAGCVNP